MNEVAQISWVEAFIWKENWESLLPVLVWNAPQIHSLTCSSVIKCIVEHVKEKNSFIISATHQWPDFYGAVSWASLHHLIFEWRQSGPDISLLGCGHRWAMSSTELSSVSNNIWVHFSFVTSKSSLAQHSVSCSIVLGNNVVFSWLVWAFQLFELPSLWQSLLQAT